MVKRSTVLGVGDFEFDPHQPYSCGGTMFEKWKSRKRANNINGMTDTNDILPQITVITTWDKADGDFYAPGVLIQVRNGRNLLRAAFSGEPRNATYYTLLFGEEPLLQFQGEEYYCPTCEKIVRSGYQLEQTEEFCNQLLNGENIPFSEALDGMKPLLGLLADNYYVVLDTKLYPTDGNGHLFWRMPDSNECLPGSCLYYRGDGEWGLSRPHFTVATQSPAKMCKSRVDYYRQHPGCRAVAYYMDGYMTALIDGHHKAMAAAVDHQAVNALVIMPGYTVRYRQEDGSYKSYVVAGDMRFASEKYGLEDTPSFLGDRLSTEEMNSLLERLQSLSFDFPCDNGGWDDNEELASYYPDVDEVAYIDEVGEICDEKLDAVLSEKYICKQEEIVPLIKALGGLRHRRLFETVDFFLQRCSYISWLRFHDTEIVEALVEQLFKLPRSEELEDYLIHIMVEYEEEYPGVGDRILAYL